MLSHPLHHPLHHPLLSQALLVFIPELAVQISEETPADVMARNMRRHSSAGNACPGPGLQGVP